MVVMRRKVKIISEETFGRRYLPTKYFFVGTSHARRSMQNMNERPVYIFLDRPQQDSYVPYSLYPFPMVSLMG